MYIFQQNSWKFLSFKQDQIMQDMPKYCNMNHIGRGHFHFSLQPEAMACQLFFLRLIFLHQRYGDKCSGHDDLCTHEYDFLYVTKIWFTKHSFPLKSQCHSFLKLSDLLRGGFLKVANRTSTFTSPKWF